MDSTEDFTAVDDTVINAKKTISNIKKGPDETSIYELLIRILEMQATLLTKVTINNRLTFMSNKNWITNKLTNIKKSYFATNEQIMNHLN